MKRKNCVPSKSVLTTVYGDTNDYPVDIVTVDTFPKRVEHAKLYSKVTPLTLTDTVILSGKDDRMKRIMREVRSLITFRESLC